MPRGTKVAKAERALRKSARKRGLKGKRKNAYIYGTLNKIGLMRGAKTTKLGRAKARKKGRKGKKR